MKHIKSYKTKDILSKAEQCGCYYCLKTFVFDEIEEFIDGKETAVCPRCGVDSVIGNNQTEIPLYDSLVGMHVNSFCWSISAAEFDKKRWDPTKTYEKKIEPKYGEKFKFFETRESE